MSTTEKQHTSGVSTFGYFLVLTVIIITIGAAGYAYIRQQRQFEINDARHDLETVADLKASQLVQWRKERLQEARSIQANAMIAHRINDYLVGSDKSDALQDIYDWISSLFTLAGYNSILLFHPDGKIITSVSESEVHLLPHYQTLIAETIRKQEVIFSDFHRDSDAGAVDIDLCIPIIHKNGTRSDCIAVLVIEVNPFRYLYPMIRHWPSPSRSAEALLVERDGNDVLFLSQMRYQSAPILTYKRSLSNKNMPAARAALGQEGVFDGLDYRGTQVYTAIRKIADSPWAIIVKIDTEEILEPVVERTYHVVALCLTMAIAIGLATYLGWSRKKAAYIHRQYEAELKHTAELMQAEQALQDAHDKLEQKVLERTAELLENRYQLNEAQRQANIGSWNWVVTTNTITWSKQLYLITGRDPDLSCITYADLSHLLSNDDWNCFDQAILRTLTLGEPYNLELELIRQDGSHCICIARGEAHHDADGKIDRLSGTLQDITERVMLERQLFQAKKLESIGQLAAGVAHEVRNPLNAILSITEALFLEMEIEGNPEYEPFIKHIRTQVNRLAQLMNDLLDLGKPIHVSSLIPFSISEFCRETIELWGSSVQNKNITVYLDGGLDTSREIVIADSQRLQQVLFNLLDNATQHSSEGCSLRLRLDVIENNNVSIPMATLQIIDSGKGIPEHTISRIFDPFYTNRKDGTGLGLALVKHFITNMGGSVIIYNNDPPPGCTAEIRIPLATRSSCETENSSD